MSDELETSFIVTNKGIYYRLLYCDKLTMNIFDKSSTESICGYCKENYPENNCIVNGSCKSKTVKYHPGGLCSIYLKFVKPWYEKLCNR